MSRQKVALIVICVTVFIVASIPLIKNSQVQVPQTVGLSKTTALKILSEAKLVPITELKASKSVKPGNVISQSLDAGVWIGKNSEIRIFVARAPGVKTFRIINLLDSWEAKVAGCKSVEQEGMPVNIFDSKGKRLASGTYHYSKYATNNSGQGIEPNRCGYEALIPNVDDSLEKYTIVDDDGSSENVNTYSSGDFTKQGSTWEILNQAWYGD